KNSEFTFENAEERVKTVMIDFLAKKFLEGEIHKVKKHFILQNIRLPRKFIWLTSDTPIPVNEIFKEKTKLSPTQHLIKTNYQELLNFPKKVEKELLKFLDQNNPQKARKYLETAKKEFINTINAFEKKINEIASKFKYINFKESMAAFFDEWPLNKKTLILYFNKLQEKLVALITKKEEAIAHEKRLSKERRIIKNFEEYLRQLIDKIELLTKEFVNYFQRHYTDQESANAKLVEFSENIAAIESDITIKSTQFTESLEVSQKPEIINELSQLLNSKIESLKIIRDEAQTILTSQEEIPLQLNESITTFRDQLAKSNKSITEKIENKEFELASKELEAQDNALQNFKTELRLNLEEKIKQIKESLTKFTIPFDNFRAFLAEKLQQLENDWNTQKEELLSKFLEKTELAKKNQLKNKLKENIQTKTEKFQALKQEIETLIKHENLSEAKSKLETSISQFIQSFNEFETEINGYIKNISKEFKNFKKNVNELVLDWRKEKNFILESMNTLMDSLKTLIIEKELLKEKNKLGLIIKNHKLLLSKRFSTILQQYRDSIQNNQLLKEENALLNKINEIRLSLKQANSQINAFIKENTKKFEEFPHIIKEQLQLWQKETTFLTKILQKLQSNIAENVLIERIYFVIKAFQGYKVELKYLAKTINMKTSQLKDKLVFLLSNSRLNGSLDPIHDMLILSSLKPIAEDTQNFLKEMEDEIHRLLKFDLKKKEAMPKELEDKKRYLLQMRYLLIIHRKVGATLFHRQFGTWEINPDLISGFLTAIQSFGSEIKSKDVPIRKMAYNEFEILLNQGELVFVALIVDGKTSEWHEKKLAEFTQAFEQEFQENLKTWSGELTQFKSTGLLIDRIFELFRVYT
ncbi:MAG: hypothetical protein ACTSYB_14360, partial [Candidatus Helarchaeota archaeon]